MPQKLVLTSIHLAKTIGARSAVGNASCVSTAHWDLAFCRELAFSCGDGWKFATHKDYPAIKL